MHAALQRPTPDAVAITLSSWGEAGKEVELKTQGPLQLVDKVGDSQVTILANSEHVERLPASASVNIAMAMHDHASPCTTGARGI